METNLVLAAVSIIFGILVIAFPAVLAWIIGIFLILVGVWIVYDRYFVKNRSS